MLQSASPAIVHSVPQCSGKKKECHPKGSDRQGLWRLHRARLIVALTLSLSPEWASTIVVAGENQAKLHLSRGSTTWLSLERDVCPGCGW